MSNDAPLQLKPRLAISRDQVQSIISRLRIINSVAISDKDVFIVCGETTGAFLSSHATFPAVRRGAKLRFVKNLPPCSEKNAKGLFRLLLVESELWFSCLSTSI